MTSPDDRRYVLISPCRDEARYMRRTLDSVARQTVPPALWVVVDDGSTDETPAILEEYAARLPYLRVVRRADRGGRSVGPGVIEAFYAGLDTVSLKDFSYLCKLDLDLDLPAGYFELLMKRMEGEPRLGTVSGKPYFVDPKSGALVSELCGDEMSVGMTKFYRTSCFAEIGGFVRQVMWDGIDCHRCRMLGWMAASTDAEDLRFIHLRLAMLWGYFKSAIRRADRYADLEFRRFLNAYQIDSLLRGKAAATRRIDERQANVWRAKHKPTS